MTYDKYGHVQEMCGQLSADATATKILGCCLPGCVYSIVPIWLWNTAKGIAISRG